MEQKYVLVAVNDKTREETLLSSSPMTHQEACVMLSKFTPHPSSHIRRMLKEI